MHAELAGQELRVRAQVHRRGQVGRPGRNDQNVVAVFDQGADGHFLYLAMKDVPGRTLKKLLRQRWPVLPRDGAGQSTTRCARRPGRSARVRHRAQNEPENVLLTPDGRVKGGLADFGLARAQAAAGHTRAGLLIGTVADPPRRWSR